MAAESTVVTDTGEVCDLYTGDCYDPESVTRFAEPNYYRDKIREFQQTMNALAETASVMRSLADTPSPEQDLIQSWLDDYEAKRWQFIAAAESLNAAAQAANALGFRMPVVTVPQGLAAAPLVIAGVASAVAVAAGLIAWAVDRIAQARAIAQRMALIAELPPEKRAEAIAAEQRIELAQMAASPISRIADIVKWVAIGVAVYFGYQAWKSR
jgi:hypothetical protein